MRSGGGKNEFSGNNNSSSIVHLDATPNSSRSKSVDGGNSNDKLHHLTADGGLEDFKQMKSLDDLDIREDLSDRSSNK